MASPSVTLREEDLSSYVQSYSASQAGFAGDFSWGPVDYPYVVANEEVLARIFGKPTTSNNSTFYTVKSYLDYSDNQVIVRSVGSKAKNATDKNDIAVVAQISNLNGTFKIGETINTSDNKTAVVTEVTATTLSYYDESEQLSDNTTITGELSGATATIVSAGKSYKSMNIKDLTGELNVNDTITGGSSSAAGVIVEINDNKIIYQLTTDNDFISNESVVTNQSATFTVSVLNGIYNHYSAGILIKNIDMFNQLAEKDFTFAARYPGELGNSILVSVGTSTNFSSWKYNQLFDNAPEANEIHLVVIDTKGKFANSYEGNILQTFAYLSLDKESKNEYGEYNNYKYVINNNSAYIYVGDKELNEDEYQLIGGVDSTPETADIINSYKVFAQPSSSDILYYYSGLYNADVDNSIIAMAEDNMKTILFTSPIKSAVMTGDDQAKSDAVVAWGNTITKSDKAFLDNNWRQVFDTYNNVYVWVPCCSATCGISSRCDTNYEVWMSPMGYTRGIYLNTTKLAWEPSKQYRDAIYKVSINPVFTDGSEGVVLLGDRTHVMKPSYFRQLAVRKTLIIIEQGALGYLKYFLGENNNAQTRALATNNISKYLRDLGARGAFRRAQVVCNETNNTEQVIDEQKMRCLIRIQPQSSINYVELTVSVVNSVAQFTENIIPGTF